MRYRIDDMGFVYRKNDGVCEAYNFKTGEWKFSRFAVEAFYEGEGTYEATEQEALDAIARFSADFALKK